MNTTPISRVLLFTPVSRGSAIARFSGLLVAALRRRRMAVDVVSTDVQKPRVEDQIDTPLLLRHWTASAEVQSCLATADLVVHQLGDDFGFHAGSVHWRSSGGIVCLHDDFLGGLFQAWSAAGNQTAANAVLREWYGRDLQWLNSVSAGAHWADEVAQEASFVEWLLVSAEGIVIHSRHGLGTVLSANGCPVEVIPLPEDYRSNASPGATAVSEHLVDTYVDGLLQLAASAGRQRAFAEIVRDYALRAGRLGIDTSPTLVQDIADLASFFGPSGDGPN